MKVMEAFTIEVMEACTMEEMGASTSFHHQTKWSNSVADRQWGAPPFERDSKPSRAAKYSDINPCLANYLPPLEHIIHGFPRSGHTADLLFALRAGVSGFMKNCRVDVVPPDKPLEIQLSIRVSRLSR